MPRPYNPYVPQNAGEIMDHLITMLSSPTFEDTTGYFPGRNIDTEFFALNEGLKLIRKKLGEERYETLVGLSDRVRAYFEADPKNNTGDAKAGRALMHDMHDLLSLR